MSAPKGWSSQEKNDRLSSQYQTVEPVRELQYASTVVTNQFVFQVGTDSAEAGSTEYSIVATSHAAKRGDVILFTSGTHSGRELKVWATGANLITLAETLPSVVANGVTFSILRHKYPSCDSSGNLNVNTTVIEQAVAADGGALPAVVKVAGGYDGSAVQVLKTDAAGELQVDILSSALPSGAATEATLSTIDADTSALAGCVGGTELQVDVVSSALPSGAATASNQTGGSQKTQVVDGAGDVVDVVALNVALTATDKGLVTNTVIHGETTGGGGGYVDVKVTPSGAMITETSISSIADVDGQQTMALSFPVVIASNQSAIPVTQSGTWNINNIAGTVSLPTGAATEATLQDVRTSVQLLDNAIAGNEMQVDVVASLPAGTNNIGDVDVVSAVASTGRSVVNRARNVYSSTNVTTSAYVQLLASTSGVVNEVEIFDSSGETLIIATGGSGSEVDQAFVFPGGNGRIPLAIGSGVRVSIKAVSALANSGEIAINFYS